jgi:hypothetical protein
MRLPALMIVCCALLLAGLACGTGVPITPEPPAGLDKAVAGTATALALSPEQTPTNMPPPRVSCSIPADKPRLPDMALLNTFSTQLLTFLNNGGRIEDLQTHLAAGHFLPTEGMGTAQMDFSGNGYLDLALTVLSPEGAIDTGMLFVYECTGERYALNYTTPIAPELGAPIIYAAQDLNGDSQADLLVGYKSCGAHTCSTQLEALVWNGSAMENRLRGSSNDLPTPLIEVSVPPDSSPAEISVTATGILSAGAGPFRRITRVWTWDAGA